MAQIRVEALDKSFGTFHAVKAASFTVEDGQFLCLLGPSGCGKTTTLRMIAGLELPTSGTIRLGGEDVTMNRASARDIAFVFQLFALYPHMNVRRNIGFPLKCEGIGAAERDRRVVEAARILRISHLLDRSVSGLAGGDRQRVALGRAIVRKPKCFLMDEPLGALDTEMREAMIHELRALHDRLGATTVYVTHDQLEAMAMADMIAVMNNGVVEQVASPRDIYDRPASLFVADFIGSPPMNFLPFRGSLQTGAQAIRLGEREVADTCCTRGIGGERSRPRGQARACAFHRSRHGAGRGLWVGISRHDADRDRDDALWRTQGPLAGQHVLSDRRECRARLSSRYAVDLRQGVGPGDPHRVA